MQIKHQLSEFLRSLVRNKEFGALSTVTKNQVQARWSQPRSQGLFPALGAGRPAPKPGKRPWERGCGEVCYHMRFKILYLKGSRKNIGHIMMLIKSRLEETWIKRKQIYVNKNSVVEKL